ncbi:citrate-binding protein-like [Mercurialis annua]|uniref:citrate-binding protein-like n=1 Tax=Mercurialis annua TaxID=3986 RepID=UPI00215F104C|nr:citrate-binding protein-like [Mercurialis annua]
MAIITHYLITCLVNVLAFFVLHTCAVDPTEGFVELPFNTSYYYIQKPYDLKVSDRYSFENGTHRLWVYSTDKPLAKSSPTRPRSEVIINGYNYTSGIWQFEGYAYVPSGTSAVCIFQVFGASPNATITTTLMLRVYDGTLKYYTDPVILPQIYDRWFKVNVIHDMDGSKTMVYIDGVKLYEGVGRGGEFHFFKFGVYAQKNETYYMESRWKGIRIFNKTTTPMDHYHQKHHHVKPRCPH